MLSKPGDRWQEPVPGTSLWRGAGAVPCFGGEQHREAVAFRRTMDYPSYLRVLLSVWVGLGLGQLVQAIHRLARFKGRILWDWLPLSWAAFAFLMVVQTWWAYFSLIQSTLWVNLFIFLLPLSVFIILYLLCASALPDVTKLAETDTLDLSKFHFAQHRYFFGLWAVLLLLALLVSRLVRGPFDVIGADGFRLGGMIAAMVLAVSKRRAVHVVTTLLAFGALAVYITLYTLRLR